VDGSANIKDRAGSNNLTLTAVSGSPTGIKSLGKYGRKAEFNGSTDYGQAVDSATFSQTGSFRLKLGLNLTLFPPQKIQIQTVLSKWDETTDIRSYRLIAQTDATGRTWPKFQISTDGTAANIKTVTGKTQSSGWPMVSLSGIL